MSLPRAIREVLAAAGIEYAAAGDNGRHWILMRGVYAVMVECTEDRVRCGSAGRVAESGMAMLVWREGEAYWQGRGVRDRADAGDIEALRRFQADVESALFPFALKPV